MKRTKYFFYCLVITILSGCAHINSDSREDRLKALASLESEEEFTTALFESRYEDVHCGAITKIKNQHTLMRVVSSGKFSDDVVCVALSMITNQPFLADIAMSQKVSEREAVSAVKMISSEQVLFDISIGTKHPAVVTACVEKIGEEHLLQKLVLSDSLAKEVRMKVLARIKSPKALGEIVESCKDCEIQEWIVTRMSEPNVIRNLITGNRLADGLKALLLDKIDDNSIFYWVVSRRENDVQFRRKALSKINSEEMFSRLLNARPIFEDWVVAAALNGISDHHTLRNVVTTLEFGRTNRTLASSKLTTAEDAASVFTEAKDEFAVCFSFPRLDKGFLDSDKGQKCLLRNFRLVDTPSLANNLFMQLDMKGVEELYRHVDQERIAKAIAYRPAPETLKKGMDALFEAKVIQDIALEKFGDNTTLTRWALALCHKEDVLVTIALKSANPDLRGRALARINDEGNIAKIAQSSSVWPLRLAAIERLTTHSDEVLAMLAQDKDDAIRTAAIKRMKAVGSNGVAELERAAKEERIKEELARQRELEEQARVDEKEKRDFEDNILRTAANIQVGMIQKYVELKKKANIKSPRFTLSGRVESVNGRIVRINILSDDTTRHAIVKLSETCKPGLMVGEPIVVSGFAECLDDNGYQLDDGEVCERGIEVR